MKIAQKLPLALLVSALLMASGVGVASYLIGAAPSARGAAEPCDGVVRARQPAQRLHGVVEGDLISTAMGDTTIRRCAISPARGCRSRIPIRARCCARSMSRTIRTRPTSGCCSIRRRNDAHLCDAAHQGASAQFRDKLLARGYGDIYLFDTKGTLVYSTTKQDDFATSFVDGPFAKTGLGDAARKALEIEAPTETTFADFSNYPLAAEPVAFLAKPVFNAQGRGSGPSPSSCRRAGWRR